MNGTHTARRNALCCVVPRVALTCAPLCERRNAWRVAHAWHGTARRGACACRCNVARLMALRTCAHTHNATRGTRNGVTARRGIRTALFMARRTPRNAHGTAWHVCHVVTRAIWHGARHNVAHVAQRLRRGVCEYNAPYMARVAP